MHLHRTRCRSVLLAMLFYNALSASLIATFILSEFFFIEFQFFFLSIFANFALSSLRRFFYIGQQHLQYIYCCYWFVLNAIFYGLIFGYGSRTLLSEFGEWVMGVDFWVICRFFSVDVAPSICFVGFQACSSNIRSLRARKTDRIWCCNCFS